MDNEQAKCILRASREGEATSGDPLYLEALALAQRDPELARWLQDESALDAAIAGKLRSLPAPAGLKAGILAGAKAAPSAARSLHRTILTIAALLVFAAIAVRVWLPILTWRADSFATFQVDMGEVLTDRLRLQFASSDLGEMQRWLAEKHRITGYQVPAPLAAGAKPAGCRTLEWNGHKLGLLCFYTPDGKVMHLLVINQADLPDARLSAQPKFTRNGSWTSAAWNAGDKIFFLMTPMDEARLKLYL